MKVRSAGRGYTRSLIGAEDSSRGGPRWRSSTGRAQHEVPVWRGAPVRDEELSQDEPAYMPGERIRHRLFGGGRIAEVSGRGRDVKAVIDFDDEAVGRKTIKLAYTTLEKGAD